ncbi:sarcosine oxidase [Melghirimyces profundicolus]|uniref:Sarcosine oxidase n=1 Tax=Melghirimyces profundicolus TaxID=1242148 RepID=A0A2T6C8Z2_9BACL|nr:N-methyl-L-tryptophan oxidase [Melghirimyces profundicolus]PTX64787.1 sarcosine oxidase [Melghirimyces profundicolus]
MDADIAVIGVGSMGSFALCELASMGVNVIGFERYAPGHDRGAGHGESRIFRTAYGEGTDYVPFLQQARDLWKHLESMTGIDIYTETGGMMIGRPNDGFLEEVLMSAEAYNLPHQVLDAEEARGRFPQHRFDNEDIVFLDPLAGVLRPELAIQAASTLATEKGARLYCGCPITALEPHSAGVTIHCEGEKFHVGHVVISAGAWTSRLLPQLSLPVWVERQIMFWYPAGNPREFVPDRFPISIRITDGDAWYALPTLDGKTVKVALHTEGERVDPDTIDRAIHTKDSELLSQFAQKYIPDLDSEPEKGKVCMYTNTPDNDFVLGSVSGVPHVTLLGPMGGHGFKFAPIMGKLAAEVATGISPSLAIDLFSPDRLIGVK